MPRGLAKVAALAALCGLTLGAACGGGDDQPLTQLPMGALELRSVDWNGAPASVGRVAAIAEAGDDAALYTDAGVLVYSSGASLGTDGSLRAFRSAAAVPSLGIEGYWLVCADNEGRLHRLRNHTTLEEVTARFALTGKPVRELAAIGGPLTAFALDTQLAISDGNMLTFFDIGDIGLHDIVGGNSRVAGLDSEGVAVFEQMTGTLRRHQLRGALGVAIAPDGTLWAATSTRLYREVGSMLTAVHFLNEAEPQRIHGLASTPRGVWVAFDDALGLIREGQLLVASLGSTGGPATLPTGAALHGSPSGDLWVIANDVLLRYGEEAGGGVDLALWRNQLLPIFAQKCQSCHLPGGSARLDLSTYSTWALRRTAIKQRVVDRLPTPMPPVTAGKLDEKELASISSWVMRGR